MGELYPFWLSSDMSSVKTQLHSDGNKGFLFCLSFVWRQSELRFSVRQLRLAHFLFMGGFSIGGVKIINDTEYNENVKNYCRLFDEIS